MFQRRGVGKAGRLQREYTIEELGTDISRRRWLKTAKEDASLDGGMITPRCGFVIKVPPCLTSFRQNFSPGENPYRQLALISVMSLKTRFGKP